MGDEVSKALGVPDSTREPDWNHVLVWLSKGHPIPDEVSKALGILDTRKASAARSTKPRLTQAERQEAAIRAEIEQRVEVAYKEALAELRSGFQEAVSSKVEEHWAEEKERLSKK